MKHLIILSLLLIFAAGCKTECKAVEEIKTEKVKVEEAIENIAPAESVQ